MSEVRNRRGRPCIRKPAEELQALEEEALNLKNFPDEFMRYEDDHRTHEQQLEDAAEEFLNQYPDFGESIDFGLEYLVCSYQAAIQRKDQQAEAALLMRLKGFYLKSCRKPLDPANQRLREWIQSKVVELKVGPAEIKRWSDESRAFDERQERPLWLNMSRLGFLQDGVERLLIEKAKERQSYFLGRPVLRMFSKEYIGGMREPEKHTWPEWWMLRLAFGLREEKMRRAVPLEIRRGQVLTNRRPCRIGPKAVMAIADEALNHWHIRMTAGEFASFKRVIGNLKKRIGQMLGGASNRSNRMYPHKQRVGTTEKP